MRKIFALTLALVLTLGASTAAVAAWLATGTGSAHAAAGSLAQPDAPSASRQSGTPSTVDLSWATVSNATAYEVYRFADDSSTSGGTRVCGPTTDRTCDDHSAPTTEAWYRVVALRNNWSSEPGAAGSVDAVSAATTMSSTITAVAHRKGQSDQWSAEATVTVTDNLGESVQGALITYKWNDGSVQPCTTDGNGQCTSADSGNTSEPTQTFEIESITKSGLTWTEAVRVYEVSRGS